MRFRRVLCVVLVLLGGSSVAAAAREQTQPRVFTVTSSDDGSVVAFVDGEAVLEIEPGALLRLRCAPGSDRWLGFEGREIQLGWSPSSRSAVDDVRVEIVESRERLELVVTGTKPEIPGARFATTISGEIDAQGRVRYTIASELELDPGDSLRAVEFLDLWFDRIFWPEEHRGTPELYQEFVYGAGAHVLRAPKLHVYTDTYLPEYPAKTLIQPIDTGSFFAVVDRRFGGILCRFDEMSTPGDVGVCWWAWDPHLFMSSPQPVSRFSYRMTIEDLDVEEASALLARAKPIRIAEDPGYQLPVFTVDGVNDFQRSVRLPGDWAWERTSLDVSVDRSIGFSDTRSATIRRTTDGRAAWFARQLWIDPWQQQMLEGRHRFTAMVRTENLTGEARLSVVQYGLPTRLLYDVGSSKVVSSASLRGTTGWTRLSVDFEITDRNAFVVLEQLGAGQTWFDDARIVPLDSPDAGEAPGAAFHARDDLEIGRRPIRLAACEVSHPAMRSRVGKLLLLGRDSEARLPRVTLEPGRYQLVLFANASGCKEDLPKVRVEGLPGVSPIVAIRPGAHDDYVVDFSLDRRQEVCVVLGLVDDGLCGAGVDRGVTVRAITFAGPR